PVGGGQGLGEALGLVVDRARPDRVDVAPVVLRLRVDERVAVDLGGGGQDESGALVPGQVQGVQGAQAAGAHGVDRIALVVRGREARLYPTGSPLKRFAPKPPGFEPAQRGDRAGAATARERRVADLSRRRSRHSSRNQGGLMNAGYADNDKMLTDRIALVTGA